MAYIDGILILLCAFFNKLEERVDFQVNTAQINALLDNQYYKL